MMQKKVAIQLGVIVVAALALVLLSIPLFKGSGNPKKPATLAVASGSLPKTALKKPGLWGTTIKLQPIKDDKFYERLSRVAEALPIDRDPFSFVFTGPKSSRDGLELSGILWEGAQPTAIINQSFVKVGDSTDQFSVISILEDRVVLRDRTGEFELRLKQ
ncbi:MAG: hypothetical protein PHV97_03085 [Candidatus Omnitrophica bacterium]|nr:hypothetical protein [Candidatus Omnitrophota bacterium]